MLRVIAKSLRRKLLLAFLAASLIPAVTGFIMATVATETVLDRSFGRFWESSIDSVGRRIDERISAVVLALLDGASWHDAHLAGPGRAAGRLPARIEAAVVDVGDLIVFDGEANELAASAGLGAEERLLVRRALVARLDQAEAAGRPPDRSLRLPTDAEGRPRVGVVVTLPQPGAGGPVDAEGGLRRHRYGVLLVRPGLFDPYLRESRLEETVLVRLPPPPHRDEGSSGRDVERIDDVLATFLRAPGTSMIIGHTKLHDGGSRRPTRALIYRQIRSISSLTGGDIEGQGWYLAATVDLSEIEAAREVTLWRTVIAVSALLLCVILLAVDMSKRITNPLRMLRREVRHLAEGKLDAQVEVPTSDELAELARDVNTMARRLAETYRNLEASIEQAEQRAGQLQVINEITTAMTSAMTLDQTFGRFGSMLQRLGMFDHCSLTLVGKGRNGTLTHHVSRHAPIVSVPFLDEEIRSAIDMERPQVTSCATMALRTGGELCSATIFPLGTRNDVIGTLNLASSRAGTFTADLIGSLTYIAEALAAAIQHNRLYEEVRDFAQSLEVKVRQRTRELENAQQRLLQVEKFAATGKLAANLAHEINNPLGIIRNHLQLLKEKYRPKIMIGADGTIQNETSDPSFGVIQEEIERIARLTRSLLNFYRARPADERMISLVQEMEEILLLVRDTLERRHVRVRLSVEGHIPESWLPPDQVRQVFMNLVRNAEDAMEGMPRGELAIAMRVSKTDGATEEGAGGGPAMIEVTVRDSGRGIPEEDMTKIFDPFFTTKGEGKGTGLGLSVTLGILNALGGSIDVGSTPGEGTTFTLRFPVRRAPAAAGGGGQDGAARRGEGERRG